VLRPQSPQIRTRPRENFLRVGDQLGQHSPVQPQRAFLITRQVALWCGSDEPVQLEPWNATM